MRPTGPHLSGEVAPGLELFEKRGQKKSGEEEDDGPEEDVRDVWTEVSTGRAHKDTAELYTLLKTRQKQ